MFFWLFEGYFSRTTQFKPNLTSPIERSARNTSIMRKNFTPKIFFLRRLTEEKKICLDFNENVGICQLDHAEFISELIFAIPTLRGAREHNLA